MKQRTAGLSVVLLLLCTPNCGSDSHASAKAPPDGSAANGGSANGGSGGGDDDLWVFVNGTLAIDLGGVHKPQSDTTVLDRDATKLDIGKGNVYSLDLFHAEPSRMRIAAT